MQFDRLSEMLNAQLDLQRSAYNISPADLAINDKISYIKDMVLALSNEVQGELLAEVDWKPWTQGARQINVDNYKKELVDAFHFFMNMMLAVDMSADELYKMYMHKRQVNIDRQLNGYDGRTTKCQGCSRALEDVTLTEVKTEPGNRTDKVFCQCGQELQLDIVKSFLID